MAGIIRWDNIDRGRRRLFGVAAAAVAAVPLWSATAANAQASGAQPGSARRAAAASRAALAAWPSAQIASVDSLTTRGLISSIR